MKRVLATLVALSLVMAMFTGVFAPVPEARAAGPATVNLLSAGNFVILAKTAVTTTGTTRVTGDIGISPALASDTAGFALVADSTNRFSTSSLVDGKVYAADYAPPTPATMSTAVSNMEAAYTDAATRTPATGASLNIGGGTVAGQTLAPGLYSWGSNVTITTDLTLSGGADDVWIFQITGTLDMATNTKVILSGGAQAKNIFWQVSDAVTLKPGSHFEGIILAQTNIAMQNGATVNGRLLAQTAVTLDANTVGLSSAELSGSITVIKDTVPNGPQDFNFTTTGGLIPATFSLDDDADATFSNTQVFSGLLPGTYTMTEGAAVGYTLTSIVGATSSDLGLRTATITLAAGGAATVTFTNNIITPTPDRNHHRHQGYRPERTAGLQLYDHGRLVCNDRGQRV